MLISGDNIQGYMHLGEIVSHWLELAISKDIVDVEIALLIMFLHILENFQDNTKFHRRQSAGSAVMDAARNGHKERNFIDVHDINC